MYHIFFILFSVNGHLGCLHVSATVDSAVSEHWDACIFLNYKKKMYLGTQETDLFFSC